MDRQMVGSCCMVRYQLFVLLLSLWLHEELMLELLYVIQQVTTMLYETVRVNGDAVNLAVEKNSSIFLSNKDATF